MSVRISKRVGPGTSVSVNAGCAVAVVFVSLVGLCGIFATVLNRPYVLVAFGLFVVIFVAAMWLAARNSR